MKPIREWTASDVLVFVRGIDQKTWFKIGIMTAVAWILVGVIIWPAWVKRVQIHGEIDTMKKRIEALEQLKQKKSELLKNKSDYARYVQDVQSRLYSVGVGTLLLGEISKLAHESKVSIIASRPQDEAVKFPPPYDQLYRSTLYDFTIEGGYHALGTFVSKIESYPKQLQIQSFRIEPKGENSTSHVSEIRLLVVSYQKGQNP
ncbi:MAG: type 4a pilus biogenesis protein PilO [Candidatus Omnitrophica bacterium]|nr:type 4a pilus biogenesis protein PilO [Candidatus Omnitrophota bacterium]